MKKPKIIVVVNQKGGVAKTTTALALGNGLALREKKVLLIDFDPQGSLTGFLGFDTDNLPTSFEWLGIQKKHTCPFNDVVLQIRPDFDLIPADISLEEAPGLLHAKPGASNYLGAAIKEIPRDYDYIVIDTSPSLSILTINALTAADELIVPFKPETGSQKGIGLLIDTISDIKVLNSGIKIDGFIVVMYDKRRKTSLASNMDYIAQIAASCGTKVYESTIRSSVSATKISKEEIFAADSAVAQDYSAFVDEFLKGEC